MGYEKLIYTFYMKQIFIASDHRGFELKESLSDHLSQKGFHVVDLGNNRFEQNDDYPVFAHKLAKSIGKNPNALGIAICGSGIGMDISLNRHHGVRSAVANSKEVVEKACEHNHINVLSLAADATTIEVAKELVDTFLATTRSNEGRHLRRVAEIELS